MFKYIVLFIMSMFTIGCVDPKENENDSIYVTKKLIYTKDNRTGLFFASFVASYYEGVLANVPCEAVEKYLEK